MRVLVCVAVLASLVALAGCVFPQAPVMAGLVIDQKGPVAGFDNGAAATKVGRAEAQGIILVGFGDASIRAAANEANITKIHHVDCNTLNVLGIYAKFETIVYGE